MSASGDDAAARASPESVVKGVCGSVQVATELAIGRGVVSSGAEAVAGPDAAREEGVGNASQAGAEGAGAHSAAYRLVEDALLAVGLCELTGDAMKRGTA